MKHILPVLWFIKCIKSKNDWVACEVFLRGGVGAPAGLEGRPRP